MHRPVGTGRVAIVLTIGPADHPGDSKSQALTRRPWLRHSETRMPAHRYPVVVGPDLALRYASAFDAMNLPTADGTTAIAGPVVDSSHLQRMRERIAVFGLTLQSLTPRRSSSCARGVGPGARRPAASFSLSFASAACSCPSLNPGCAAVTGLAAQSLLGGDDRGVKLERRAVDGLVPSQRTASQASLASSFPPRSRTIHLLSWACRTRTLTLSFW